MAHILIIDNVEKNIATLTENLTSHGHQVSVARQAVEGLEIAAQFHPDLIMVAFLLPRATGAQVCFKIRQHASTSRIPVIVHSDPKWNPEHEQFVRVMGAQEYLPKPSKVIDVGDIVDRYVDVE